MMPCKTHQDYLVAAQQVKARMLQEDPRNSPTDSGSIPWEECTLYLIERLQSAFKAKDVTVINVSTYTLEVLDALGIRKMSKSLKQKQYMAMTYVIAAFEKKRMNLERLQMLYEALQLKYR